MITPAIDHIRSASKLLWTTHGLALASFALQWLRWKYLLPFTEEISAVLIVAMTLAWALSFILLARRAPRKAWWALLTTPLALFIPGMLVLVVLSCAFSGVCL